ncbi:hypothetical protein [Chakrabartyella piscis]|uniref:hypothetical protein n=1 Tax=Chakrabartyella piscis TaxID=2918914 RepID=UPI003A7F34A8
MFDLKYGICSTLIIKSIHALWISLGADSYYFPLWHHPTRSAISSACLVPPLWFRSTFTR